MIIIEFYYAGSLFGNVTDTYLGDGRGSVKV